MGNDPFEQSVFDDYIIYIPIHDDVNWVFSLRCFLGVYYSVQYLLQSQEKFTKEVSHVPVFLKTCNFKEKFWM